MDQINGMYIGLGIVFFVMGIVGVKFNYLPNKEKQIEKLSKKYNKEIDEMKFTRIEGIFNMLIGVSFIVLDIFLPAEFFLPNNTFNRIILVIGIVLLWSVIYYPIRKKYLNLK